MRRRIWAGYAVAALVTGCLVACAALPVAPINDGEDADADASRVDASDAADAAQATDSDSQ